MPSQDESVWARLNRNYEKFQEARREHCLHRGGSLRCVGCGRTDRHSEKGWRTYLTLDSELATYCPDCAAPEFGDGVGGRQGPSSQHSSWRAAASGLTLT
jgi:hypothetical protein